MAKTKISEFSATPGNNTDIDGINIAEGCAPSGINDAIRELMSQLKDFQAGTAGDSFNGPVGTTTAAAGAFTTLTTSSTVTLSGGTANGVAYLNGSKVLTTGSALTFNGTTFATTAIGSFTGGVGIAGVGNPSSGASVEITYGAAGFTGVGRIMSYDRTGAARTPLAFDGSYQQWLISNTEGMRLTSTGLGIGTSSPGAKLHLNGAALLQILQNDAAYIQFRNTAGTDKSYIQQSGDDFLINNQSNGVIQLRTNNTIRATLDSSGNLGLGVTPSAWSGVNGVFEIKGNAYIYSTTGVLSSGANAYFNGTNWIYKTTQAATRYEQVNGTHQWGIAPSGTAGNAISFTQAMTLDANGNLVIGLTSAGARLDASIDNPTRGIVQRIRNGASSTQTGSQLQFTQNGVADWVIGQPAGTDAFAFWSGRNPNADGTERARIDSSGNLLVGQTSNGFANNNGIFVNPTASGGLIGINHASGSASGQQYCAFGYNGSQIGSITQSGTTAVLYNVTSDQRLKENIQDADSASALIDSLQVRKYDWKSDGAHQRYGFIAQELVTVAPEAVHQPADPEEMMAVDYSKLVPMLVKEIQSLRARVAQLESN